MPCVEKGDNAYLSGLASRGQTITIQGTLPGTAGEVSGGWDYEVRDYSWGEYLKMIDTQTAIDAAA